MRGEGPSSPCVLGQAATYFPADLVPRDQLLPAVGVVFVAFRSTINIALCGCGCLGYTHVHAKDSEYSE